MVLSTLDRVSCTNYFMSIEIIRCSVRRIETTKPDKKNCGKITLYRFNMTQQCAVAGLPRETNDGRFDAANANKSCVRDHGGQSSEFPIYPTTRERGITLLELHFRGDENFAGGKFREIPFAVDNSN